MIIKDKIIEVRVSPNTKNYYEKLLNQELKNKETISIKQKDVYPVSRTIVECICDMCNSLFKRQMCNIKGKTTFCNLECRNNHLRENNPNPKKDKIKVKCAVCTKCIEVNEAKFKKQKHFLCSRDCYKTHRSKKYRGNELYNYQNIVVTCEYCNNQFKTIKYDLNNRNHLFCSQDCYFSFRKDNYKEVYFATYLNDSRKETLPEKMVRKYLNTYNINYIQEFNINNTYYADFLLKDFNVIVEVYGDYWHGNPKIYGLGKKELNEIQSTNIKRDRRRNAHLSKMGFSVYIIWESDIKKDVDYHMGMIINDIVNKQESATTARQAP